MKIHRFLFYLLLILLPTQLTKYFFPEFAFVSGIRVDYLAPVVYLSDLIIVGIIILWLFEYVAAAPWAANPKARQGRVTTIILIGIIGITILLNIFFTTYPTIALLKWLRFTETAFLVFYIAKTKPNVRTAIYCLVFSGFYSCVLAWIQFIHQSSIGGAFWWIGERTFTVTTPGIARTTFENKLFLRPYATFPHPNVLAGFLTCLIPFIFYIRKRLHLFFVPLLILFLATIFITFSQSAWIVAAITTLVFVLKEKSVRLRKPSVIFGFLTLALFLSFISYQFIERESIARRLDLNNNAFSIIKEKPLFGVGLNNFILANDQQTISSYQDLQPVHSIYLLYLSETGIAGVLLFVAITLMLYRKIKINSVSFYYIWSFGTLLVFGLFDHYPITIHQTLLLGGVLVGFILSSNRMLKS